MGIYKDNPRQRTKELLPKPAEVFIHPGLITENYNTPMKSLIPAYGVQDSPSYHYEAKNGEKISELL